MFKHAKKVAAVVAVLAASALGGAAIASATSSQSTTTGTSTQSGSGTQAPPAFKGPAHGTAVHEDAEKPVTGTAAAKARAAAVKSVGGGTAGPVTTDLSGTGYETTVTKTDGSKVEVHLDSSYNAFQRPGGPGGPDGPGGPGGPPPAGHAG